MFKRAALLLLGLTMLGIVPALGAAARTPATGRPAQASTAPPLSHPDLFPPGAPVLLEPPAPPSAARSAVSPPGATSGSWTPLNDQPYQHLAPFYPNGEFLLTNGRVLVQDGNFTSTIGWWR